MGCCGEIIHGAAGLVKAGMQSLGIPIDAAPLQVVLARRDVCRQCHFATRNPSPAYAVNQGLTSLSMCRECNCLIAAKTKLASEKCPIRLWGKFPA